VDLTRPPGAQGRAWIVRATRSIVCPPDAAQAAAAKLGAEVREVVSGHCASLDEPDALARCLEECFTTE
jgi:pimeloyl-ACP methyl ester carboxylesterase